MRVEVHSAADFLMNLLRVKQANPLSDSQLQNFKGSLEDVLFRKYRSHWYVDNRYRGSGYRCIRINGKMDPVIEKAGYACGLNSKVLNKMFPRELTMWIDPEEVSYRIGENGSICVLYDKIHQSRASPSSDLDSTGSLPSGDEFIMERCGRSYELSSSDLGFMMDFIDVSTTTTTSVAAVGAATTSTPLTKAKFNSNNNNNHNIINKSKQRHNNNSFSSSSSGQLSPPLSPQYTSNNQRFNNQLNHHHQQQQHLQQSHHHQQQQQYKQLAQQHHHHFSSTNAVNHNNNNNKNNNLNFEQHPFILQNSSFNNHYVGNNKVRTQC